MGLFVFLSLLPIVPWYFLGPVRSYAFNYENITHFLGQIAGLVGMAMLALTFVLSTRLRPIEKLMGGLDKNYIVHRIFGSIAFMLVLLHPILLALKYIPYNMRFAAEFLLPGSSLAINSGIIALAGMIILLVITFYINIKYNYWKLSHKFLGLFFIFAVFHIFLVRQEVARDYIFHGYYIYVGIVSAIGIIAFLYTLFFKSTNIAVYKIISIKKHSGKFVDLEMAPLKKHLNYKAGQFAFFRFHNKSLSKEYHPFSIASPSNSQNIRIIAKKLGDFTNRMDALNIGDKVSVEGPYGEFIVKDRSDDLVWIAGGIGITPFIGMAKDIFRQKHKGTVSLYYSARTPEDFVALDELKPIERMQKVKFRLSPWPSDLKGNMSLKNIKPLSKKSKVYLCGPDAFKKYFLHQLAKFGMPKENIFEEDFALK